MHLARSVLAAALVVGLALSAAGAGERECSYPLQECLDAMVKHLQGRGWLGIEFEIDEETGTRTVLRVVPASPAEAAGLRPGDVLLALDGIDLGGDAEPDPKKIDAIMVPGNRVTYTVARTGRKKKLKATLAPVSRQVLEQWVGRHMLEHYQEPPGEDRPAGP